MRASDCPCDWSNSVSVAYLLMLLSDVCHIASPQQTLPAFFQLVLFVAAAAASPQDFSPADAIFLRVVLLHVSLGPPLLLVPSGAQPRLTFVISAGLLKTCPMYRHLLFLLPDRHPPAQIFSKQHH